MQTRCPFLVVLGVVAALSMSRSTLAQEQASTFATILAAGEGCPDGAAVQILPTRAEQERALRSCNFTGDLPSPPAGHTVRFLPLGKGRGGALRIADVLRGDRIVLRLAGASDAPVVARRFAIVSTDDRRSPQAPAFEVDAPDRGGRPTFRIIGVDPESAREQSGKTILPLVFDLVEPPDSQQLITDMVTFRDFCWRYRKSLQGIDLVPFSEQLDFQSGVVLVRPMRRQAARKDGAQFVEFFFGRAGAVVRPFDYDSPLPIGRVPDTASPVGLYVVPRGRGFLDHEGAVPGHADEVVRAARFAIPDPLTAPQLEVLRFAERHVESRATALCRRVTTPAEWRELRQEMDEFADLPDDWCSFTDCSIVVLATEVARVWPGLRPHVVEEEGVDVLTFEQFGPSGVDPGKRSFAAVVVVPDRKGQLAVVLRQRVGPGPPMEKTLRVFPGNGR